MKEYVKDLYLAYINPKGYTLDANRNHHEIGLQLAVSDGISFTTLPDTIRYTCPIYENYHLDLLKIKRDF